MQTFTERGEPLCGACPEIIAEGELYVVVHQRAPVDTDSSAMVHLAHFRGMAPGPSSHSLPHSVELKDR